MQAQSEVWEQEKVEFEATQSECIIDRFNGGFICYRSTAYYINLEEVTTCFNVVAVVGLATALPRVHLSVVWVLKHPLLGFLVMEFRQWLSCLWLLSNGGCVFQKVIKVLFNSDWGRSKEVIGIRQPEAFQPHLHHGGWLGHSVLSLLFCASPWQLHISAPQASTLHCRVAEQRYGIHTAFIYFQFLSPFITLTVPFIQPPGESWWKLCKAGLDSRITVKTINLLYLLQHRLNSFVNMS